MREIRCSIDLRAAEGSPGRIVRDHHRNGPRRGRPSPRYSRRAPCSGQQMAFGLLAEHRGRQIMRVTPTVDGTAVRVDAALPDTAIGREVASEVRAGTKRGLSLEFHCTEEAQVQGVREVRGAIMDAAAVVADGAYSQALVEVREKERRPLWLWL